MFEAKMLGRFLVTLLGLLFAAWIAVIVNFHNLAIHIDRGMDHLESLRKNSLDIISLTEKQNRAARAESQDAAR
ncbi:hypothetical protein GTU79_06230 [Sodalis ligni]|jgi:1,4-dihydroxy-2-naphthoate octaprenyltransferase|nr:hypothetical protein [Sodalis ligni]QWA12342.1 hypothetical protein GTU79_06230 [Sodalis ligni]